MKWQLKDPIYYLLSIFMQSRLTIKGLKAVGSFHSSGKRSLQGLKKFHLKKSGTNFFFFTEIRIKLTLPSEFRVITNSKQF